MPMVWKAKRNNRERERVLSSEFSRSSKVRWSHARQAGAMPESHTKSETQKMALKCTAPNLEPLPWLFVFLIAACPYRFQSCHVD